MIAEAVRRSPLAEYRDRFVALSAATRGDILVRELPYLAQINFRADPNDTVIMQRLASTIGFALPVAPNTTTSQNDRRALWLGPDEWLLCGPEKDAAQIARDVETSLARLHHALVDVGHARVALSVSGPRADDVINCGCALSPSPMVLCAAPKPSGRSRNRWSWVRNSPRS